MSGARIVLRASAAATVVVGLAAACFAGASPGLAHEGQPIQVQITEREPGLFTAQWRVSRTIPLEAMPVLLVPEACRAEGQISVVAQAGGWLNRRSFRCERGLAGRKLAVGYPLFNPSMAVLIRVELLSGERLVHALAPTEDGWLVPDMSSGSLVFLRGAQSGVLGGARHVFGNWVHLVFAVALVLFGARASARLIGAFAIGQLAAVGGALALGFRPDQTAAEVSVAIAVAFLAGQALQTPEDRRDLAAVAAVAGLFHGLGLVGLASADGAGPALWLYTMAVVLGMDAALLVLAAGVSGLLALAARYRPRTWDKGLAYAVGGIAVALALTLAFRPGGAEETESAVSPQLPGAGPLTNTLPGSRRVAPESSGMPVESFLTIGPYEIRHEVLLRVGQLASDVGLDTAETWVLPIERQAEIGQQLAELVLEASEVHVDGSAATPLLDRVDFMTVGPRGALPRPTPVEEAVEEALVGVTVAYLTPSMPDAAALTWKSFSESVSAIPVTATDPEFSRTLTLAPETPSLEWTNELTADPVAAVTAVAVEPARFPMPLLALPLLLAAAAFAVIGFRDGQRRVRSFAVARVTLGLALIVGPMANVAVALPASLGSTPSAGQVRRILASVLPNVYRAFELRDESAAYDRLAVSVTGETLTDVYLEHRRALEMEERGGARARVEAVEILEVAEVSPRDERGFSADATWNVGGTVSHFGHRHFRQNRYHATIELLPVDGTWKIRSIEILDEQRVQ